MGVKIANFVKTTLSADINGSVGSMTVASVSGWPSITTPVTDYFYLTLIRVSNNAKEIVKVTDYTGTTATIVRAQESTSGLALVAGDRVELNVTAQTIRDLLAEEAAARAAMIIAEAQFGALTIPGSAIKDSAIINRHIADGTLNGAKLNPAVAGTGMIQDAFGNLQVQGGTYVQAYTDYLDIRLASLVNALSSYKYNASVTGRFAAHDLYGSSTGGTGIFYTGVRPFTPIYGDDDSHGGRFVNVTVQNDHATLDIHVSCYVGATLDYYKNTGSDVGTEVKKCCLSDSDTFGDKNMVDWTIWVPPGYRYMFAAGNGVGSTGVGTGGVKTGGTPNILQHNWFDLK